MHFITFDKMKKFILFIFGLSCLQFVSGQDSSRLAILEEMGPNAVIYQSQSLTSFLEERVNYVELIPDTVAGWRLQVWSRHQTETSQEEMFNLVDQIEALRLGVAVYPVFQAPNWKVRVGDYSSHADALVLKAEILKQLPELEPEMSVVRDSVIIYRR